MHKVSIPKVVTVQLRQAWQVAVSEVFRVAATQACKCVLLSGVLQGTRNKTTVATGCRLVYIDVVA